MELNNRRNSACYMPSMDGMRVAVYLLYIMHVCCTFGLLPVVVLALLQPIPALTQHYMQWMLGHLRHPVSEPSNMLSESY